MTPSITLAEILAHKQAEVAALKASNADREFKARAKDMPPPRGFAQALAKAQQQGYGLIAEFKRASPSRPAINPQADPAAVAQAYEAGGASCMSVLTDGKYFAGSMDDLTAAASASLLPILRKDFMLDAIQVSQARAYGADCILLILTCLEDAQVLDLAGAAQDYGMDVLLEVHTPHELQRALTMPSALIGINNRDLATMKTDLGVCESLLAGLVPETTTGRIFIAESGLRSSDDVNRLARAGARCFLIGEALMEADDIAWAISRLLANPLPPNWREVDSPYHNQVAGR